MNTTIVSERLAHEVEESGVGEKLSNKIEVKSWSEFSPQSIIADHLVLDLNFIDFVDCEQLDDIPLNSRFEGKQRNLREIDQDKGMLLDRFQTLQNTDLIPNYLSSGCSLTVLYSDMLTLGEPPEGTHTHYWLRILGILDRTIPLHNANFSDTGISDYNVISGSEPIQDYFEYVEGYTHILGFEDGNRTQIVENNPESIAESGEENIIAAQLGKFRNRSGEVLELEGNLTLLPQPTRLQPVPQNLIEALATIGEVDEDDQKPVTHGLPSDSSNLPRLITSNVQKELNKSSHGDEVLQQIEDGDACVSHDLLQPALGSYIHAIEWAFIAYLESEEGIDIIQKEQQGGMYYNLAGGHHSLLDEVQKHVNLSQKVVGSISSINQAERRWMAHHKSGETLAYDTLGLRTRLGTIIEELFT